LFDSAVRTDQKGAAHDSFEISCHKLLDATRHMLRSFCGWSPSSGKLSFCFFLKFARAFSGSALTPKIATFSLSKLFFASRNSDASVVQPGCWPSERKKAPRSFPEIPQRNDLARVALQREVRCFVCNFQHILCTQPPSSFFSISFTVCGFAWPRVALMTARQKI